MPDPPHSEHEQPPVTTEVDRLLAIVQDRYGSRLSPAQLEEVKKGVESIVQAAAALRAVRLHNSDEPAQPFVPFRADA